MNCIVTGLSVENNKYHLESMTLRFAGAPTVKQAVAVAKHYSKGVSIKPDFANPNFEVHMAPDGDNVKVQFFPCVKNLVKTTNRR